MVPMATTGGSRVPEMPLLPDAVCFMTFEGQIVWVNDKFCDLSGYRFDEMLARPKFSLMHPDDRMAMAEILPTAFEGGGNQQPLQIRLQTSSGEWKVAELLVRVDVEFDGQPLLVVSLREVDEVWNAVLTALVEDAPFTSVMEKLAAAVGTYDSAGILIGITAVGEEGRQRYFASSRYPRLAPLLEYLDDHWEQLVGPTEHAMVQCLESFDALPGDLRRVAKDEHFGAAWAFGLGDPDGPDGLRYLALLDSPARRASADWGMSHRPQEFAMLALLNRRRQRELRHAATHDPLTGLANRTPFFDRLMNLAPGGSVGLLFVDLDGFKSVNDDHGHSAGDAVLIEIADRLRVGVRPDDLVARLGGDEFGVICPGVEGPDVVTTMADRLVAMLSEEIALDSGARVQVGASVGVAVGRSVDSTQIFDAADTAMYEVKREGKNGWRLTVLTT